MMRIKLLIQQIKGFKVFMSNHLKPILNEKRSTNTGPFLILQIFLISNAIKNDLRSTGCTKVGQNNDINFFFSGKRQHCFCCPEHSFGPILSLI